MRARRIGKISALALAALFYARAAEADPYRLRADVYAFGSAPVPAGLVVLSGQHRATSWVSAEALVWMGSGEATGDVLTANVRLRDPEGRGEVRLGRMLTWAGAVRPLPMDGASVLGRIPGGPTLQVFGGVPVEPQFGARAYDWAVGSHLSQTLGGVGSVGISYLQRRTEGNMAFQEIGFDAALSPFKWVDSAASLALDLLRASVNNARMSVAIRTGPARFEFFGIRRTPAHLLPATSLFAALGDVATAQAGLTLAVKAFPRLDVWGTSAFESIAGDLGGSQSLNATLRLDDRGDGAVGLELRRQWAPDSGWTAARGMLRLPLVERLRFATELEAAVPDSPDGRGDVWPWGLVALSYAPVPRLDVTAGVEASASPSYKSSITAIARASMTWEGGR